MSLVWWFGRRWCVKSGASWSQYISANCPEPKQINHPEKEKYTKTQNREKHLDEKISSSFLNDSFFMTQINAPKTLGQIILSESFEFQKRKEDF